MQENRFDLELVAETVTHLRVTVKKGDEYARGVIYGGVREVGSMAVGSIAAVELDENGSGRLVMPEVSCRGGYYDVYYYDAERGYECKLVWGKIVASPRLAPAMSEQLVEFEAGVPVQDGGEVVVRMAVGERGEKGEKGDKGDKGDKGEPGVPGDVWGEIRLKDADIVPMYELGVGSAGIDFYYNSGSGMRQAGRLGLEASDYNGRRGLKLHNNMPLVIGGTRFNPELMGGAVIASDGTLYFNSPTNGGDTVYIYGATVLETVTGQSATFSGEIVVGGGLNASSDALVQGRVQANKGIHALPLGTTTALGAPAYGLSVSADGGLQLWGTHFMLSDGWSDTALKVVNNAVGLTSTDEASLSFDYANTVHFRTMPNDGDGNGVYEFECYKWTDDSHTTKEQGYVDVRKKAAMAPTDESLLNRSENDSRYGKLAGANEWSGVQTIYAPDGKYGANKIIQIRDASGEYPGYNICFRNGGSLEIFDESQDPTRNEPYFQIYRPFGNRTYACNNFCVKGTTEMRKAVTLTSSSSLTANCPATFKGAVTFTQAPVLPGMFAGDANSVSNAYSALGLALLSPMWVQTAYFNNVTVKAGTANSVSKTVGVRGLVHWASGNATVSETGFIQPSAESNVYGGLEGFWQPIHFYTNEGWVKVSFGVNGAKLTSAEYTVSDFALNEKDVFVYAPTAVQSDSFNGYVDITFMRTSSTKTTVRTRFLKKASNSSTWYLEEQVAEVPLVLTGWGNSMQGFGGARNAEKNKVLFFVHHGPAIYKVAEFESPWLVINDSKVNFALSAGDLGASDYSYTTIENQRIYMRADLFGGEFACPFFEVLNNCAQNVITTIIEPVIYEPVSSDVE